MLYYNLVQRVSFEIEVHYVSAHIDYAIIAIGPG
jgi:hypothetical protein